MATDKRERLVNLVVALLETRTPLTLAELRRRTREYTQSDTESARRQFERDKDDLRALGVPVETIEGAFGGDVGYRIDRTAYELPDVSLDPDQVAALALAVQLTGDDRHRLALAKLAARAPDPTADAPDDASVRVEVGLDPVDHELADALVRRTTLAFRYRTAAGDEADRRVDPFAVVQRRGAWYLVGHDHDRDARRAFRLDRIVDGVTPTGDPGAFAPPEDLDVAAAVAGPASERVPVRLAVRGAARFDVELRGASRVSPDDGQGGAAIGDRGEDVEAVYELEGFDPVRDRAWLLGLGAQVRVQAPDDLRAQLLADHRRVAQAHGAPGDDPAADTDGEAGR